MNMMPGLETTAFVQSLLETALDLEEKDAKVSLGLTKSDRIENR